MDDVVQCAMGNDYYEGPYCYESTGGEYKVPRELLDRWEEAESAWKEAQDEMADFMRKNMSSKSRDKLWGALTSAYADQIIASLRPLPDWIKNAGH